MDIEIAGLVGFVFAVTAVGALICERRTDVLHGAYVEGRLRLQTAGLIHNPLLFFIDRLGQRVIRVASLA